MVSQDAGYYTKITLAAHTLARPLTLQFYPYLLNHSPEMFLLARSSLAVLLSYP